MTDSKKKYYLMHCVCVCVFSGKRYKDFFFTFYSVFFCNCFYFYYWIFSLQTKNRKMLHSPAEVMRTYKTKTCEAWKRGFCTKTRHECFDSHSVYPERRSPVVIYQQFNYIARKCPNYPNCAKGLHCKFSHGALELCYHPSLYKTQMCCYSTNEEGICTKFGTSCAKAHEEQELRKSSTSLDVIPQDRYRTFIGNHQEYMHHYKTKPCYGFPYRCECDGFDYHYEMERRRNPFVDPYFAYSCPRIYSQASGWRHPRIPAHCYANNYCTSTDAWNCKFAHTFVEWLYHPDVYKMMYCPSFMTRTYCRFGKACPKAHGPHDLRVAK